MEEVGVGGWLCGSPLSVFVSDFLNVSSLRNSSAPSVGTFVLSENLLERILGGIGERRRMSEERSASGMRILLPHQTPRSLVVVVVFTPSPLTFVSPPSFLLPHFLVRVPCSVARW